MNKNKLTIIIKSQLRMFLNSRLTQITLTNGLMMLQKRKLMNGQLKSVQFIEIEVKMTRNGVSTRL